MFPVKYELGFYILEGVILHGHRFGSLKSYMMMDNSAETYKAYICSKEKKYEKQQKL
jgi:hypothetical protein